METKSKFTVEELKHEVEINSAYLDEYSAHTEVSDALLAKLNRLAALEAVSQEIVEYGGSGICTHTKAQAEAAIVKQLKAVLEEDNGK